MYNDDAVGILPTGVVTTILEDKKSTNENPNGVTSVSWLYPESDVFVFWAYVSTAQQIMTSPVMLTVGLETELSMNVEQGGGFDHIVSGRLLCGGNPVANKQVVIKVNGTVVDVVETSGDGSYSSTLNLGAVDDKPTSYQVEVVFYGDNALNLTGMATLPNGTKYAVCTTLQYFGFKPASNTAWLTVEPQTTQVAMSEKTPEEMQQEAEDSGWLSIWHEWSWWYPWYRCHLVLDANLPQGHLHMDYGWTFLPFGQTFDANNVIAYVFNDMTTDIVWDVIESFLVGLFIQHAMSLILGRTLVGVVIAIAAYLAYSMVNVIRLYKDSIGNPNAWLAAFVASAISGTFGLFKAKLEGLMGFLTAISRQVLGKISHVMNSFWARGLNFFDITGIAFSLIDFALMVLYLTQYSAVI